MAWRSTIFALRKSKKVSEAVKAIFELHTDLCRAVCIAPACAACKITNFFGDIFDGITFSIGQLLNISERLYKEIVGRHNGMAISAKVSAVYMNEITTHGNVRASYKRVLDVYTIMTGLKSVTTSRRRLQVMIDCTNTSLVGNVANCNKPSCENPTLLCDGSNNYEYISQLERGENNGVFMYSICVAHTKLSYLLSP